MVQSLVYCLACEEMNAISTSHDPDETVTKQAKCDNCGSEVEIKFKDGSVEQQTIIEDNS